MEARNFIAPSEYQGKLAGSRRFFSEVVSRVRICVIRPKSGCAKGAPKPLTGSDRRTDGLLRGVGGCVVAGVNRLLASTCGINRLIGTFGALGLRVPLLSLRFLKLLGEDQAAVNGHGFGRQALLDSLLIEERHVTEVLLDALEGRDSVGVFNLSEGGICLLQLFVGHRKADICDIDSSGVDKFVLGVEALTAQKLLYEDLAASNHQAWLPDNQVERFAAVHGDGGEALAAIVFSCHLDLENPAEGAEEAANVVLGRFTG